MLKKVKVVSLLSCLAFTLQACHEEDDASNIVAAPQQFVNVNTAVYNQIRQDPGANLIFSASGAANIGDEACDVKMFRMKYDTVGGAAEMTTSSGVFMLPHGDDPRCKGPLPVVLYGHGTRDDSRFDMSQFISDPTNQGTFDSTLLLASFASNGYAVVAPNFAGFADSTLDYHPYLNNQQQAAEMMDALDHVREHADILGADLSSQLFVAGASAGANSAMATQRALESSGETVTAGAYNSGPYALLDFLDTVMAGYPGLGVTTFLPMGITSFEKAYDIYDDPREIYTDAYADIAENVLPRVGGTETAGLPATALFSGEPPEDANAFQALGFGSDHLIADSFRAAYLADAQSNPTEPAHKPRAAIADNDLRNWTPKAPLLMCGANVDPTVYYKNTELMAEYWSDLVTAGLVSTLDLSDTPAGPFAPAMAAYQNGGFEVTELHGATEIFCAPTAKNYFDFIRSQQSASVEVVSSN